MKNIAPIYLYMISVVCFVIANVVRDQFLELYYVLLIVGVILCILGFKNRIQK
ncbi:hypothetical protein [Flavobacterium seoulense]|uniref:Uncharacterized protein n=1 Tax=Flavobacterium seoulense TaxID=1492738 RepID=A0A066WQ76_9FLAO|nr:hypothetical protein [Flavobacterium seoulense]KDN54723.1 hypothetical protein FEM21_21050 [Flavobacterium seoulense]